MGFLTINKKGDTKRTPKKPEGSKVYKSGIVYLMKCELDDGVVVIKIGVTGRANVMERFMENISAFFMCHRYVPRTTLIKFSRTKDYYKAETLLHRLYVESKYTFIDKFQGSSEYFIIEDEDKLKDEYARILKECQAPPEVTEVPEDDEYESMNDLDPNGL